MFKPPKDEFMRRRTARSLVVLSLALMGNSIQVYAQKDSTMTTTDAHFSEYKDLLRNLCKESKQFWTESRDLGEREWPQRQLKYKQHEESLLTKLRTHPELLESLIRHKESEKQPIETMLKDFDPA